MLSSPVFCWESPFLEPLRIILVILIITLLISGNLAAQDTLRTVAPAPPDSSFKSGQSGMVMYWYDIHNDLKSPGDTSYNELYQESERIGLN